MRISKRKRTILSKLFAVFLAMEVLLVPSTTLLAKKIPSASQIATELEQRYHLNTGAIQNFGETFNVSDTKKTVPEVSLFFSPTDPREGEKITARAFPMYFSNPSEQLYYTWYLKRKGCDLGSAAGKPAYCNADGVGGITTNDWKVMASRIIAQNGYNNSGTSYASDSDDDGYKSRFGGNAEVNKPDWCYVYDSAGGKIYELSSNPGSFSCGSGRRPACVAQTSQMTSGTINYDPFNPTSSTVFTESSTGEYYVSGTPSCSVGNVASCGTGAPYCIPDNDPEPLSAGDLSAISCVYGGSSKISSRCEHLFPEPKGVAAGETTGDNIFKQKEEQFWGTDPNDPDTSDNGNKDEANIVGLGLDSFIWNYEAGDQVGLAVEGVSMIPTKHNDSSSAIMWAFSRNNCPVSGTGSYTTTIQGYSVTIPTSNMSLNDCIEKNLVDPLEGGQATKLEVGVTYSPDNPVNDATEEGMGDILTVSASVNNSTRAPGDLLYAWTVEANSQSTGGTWQDITARLRTAGLVGSTTGNGLNTIPIALNMDNAFLSALSPSLFGADPIYLRVSAQAEENFSSGVKRVGRSDVIVRVTNTDKKIIAYSTKAFDVGGVYKVSVDSPICDVYFPSPASASEAMENLNKIACRVVKNEIVGVRMNASGLSDFQWTINGLPISCSSVVSTDPQCADGNEVFFAAAGDPGETYTLQVNANDVTSGKTVVLSRTFQIVEPEVMLETADDTVVWPKYLGEYKDVYGNSFSDYSDVAFEKFDTGNTKLKAKFIPSFVGSISTREWVIDGEIVPESTPFEIDYASATPKPIGGVYNVSFSSALIQPDEKRRALKEIWGIDDYQSSETRVSESVQVDVVENEYIVQGPKTFFAALGSYIPSSVLFAFRMIVTMALLLFVVGFIFALIPEIENEEVIISRRE